MGRLGMCDTESQRPGTRLRKSRTERGKGLEPRQWQEERGRVKKDWGRALWSEILKDKLLPKTSKNESPCTPTQAIGGSHFDRAKHPDKTGFESGLCSLLRNLGQFT